jgi:hypothetical protein
MLDPERIEKGGKHLALVGEMVADEQTGGEALRHRRHGEQIPNLLGPRQRLDELEPEVVLSCDERHRLDLLFNAIAFGPEGLGGIRLLLERQVFPELSGRLGHG